MSFKGNIPALNRGFYFDPSAADDTLSGLTLENPKKTIQAAIDIAAALTPPPSITETAQISAAQGASVATSFVLEDFVQFDGRGILLSSDATVAVELASTLAFELTGVFNDKLNGICFKVNNETSLLVRNGTLRVFGTDGIGFDITGICDDLFFIATQVLLAGERAIGFKMTASSPTPVDINSSTVVMDGNDTVFVDWGPPALSDIGTVEVSTISATGTGTEIFTVRSGRLEVEAVALQADQIVTIKNTAEFSLSAHTLTGNTLVETGGSANYKSIGRITGDIEVQAGATLDIMCIEHIGTITNNGTINGRIGGQLFGTWGLKPVQEFVLTGSSSNTQEPTGTDSPIKVEFGAAQFGPSDPVEIDVLGNITINQTDQYIVDLVFHAGRTGAGSFAVILFRLLINGVQTGDSTAIRLDNANTHAPVAILKTLNLVVTDVLTVEIWRDPSGFDAGGLFPETPSLSGSNPVPSAAITMTRYRLTPLV